VAGQGGAGYPQAVALAIEAAAGEAPTAAPDSGDAADTGDSGDR